MTVLYRLKTMKDTEIQNWLRKVGRENVTSLAAALAGADDEVKNCVYKNMSAKARTMLAADVAKNKKLKIKDVAITASAAILEKML